MKKINIPGKGTIELEHIVLDFNGTLAADGKLIPGVSERILQLSKDFRIHVITADTNGSVIEECRNIPVNVHIIGRQQQDEEKQLFVEGLTQGTVAIGNGRNDVSMFLKSTLAIAVIGDEGCYTKALLNSDVVVKHIHCALDLLLKPHRLIATLRN